MPSGQAARRGLGSVLVLGLGVSLAIAVPPVPPCQADATIVVEVYVGKRPPDADRLIGPVIQALRASGARAGVRAVGDEYEASQSRPGVAVDQAALDGRPELVNRGFEAWTEARFAEATSMLGRAVTSAEHAPAALIMDGDLRGAFRKDRYAGRRRRAVLVDLLGYRTGDGRRNRERQPGPIVRRRRGTGLPLATQVARARRCGSGRDAHGRHRWRRTPGRQALRHGGRRGR